MFASRAFRSILREAAPNLSRRYFSCGTVKCSSPRRLAALEPCRLSPRSWCTADARRSFRASTKRLQHLAASHSQTTTVSTGFFPQTTSNTVAYWLFASAASVFGIVVFGGLTRLTESGLSITEWKPVTGSLPPMSDQDWESEFAKYRASPEFLILNSRMTMEEFKNIYWMEWIHRVWGRFVGLSFVLPAVYFVAQRKISRAMVPKLTGIAALIGFQGFLGWWMVKSGLKDDFLSPDRKPGRDVPRVSQYRLAAHLGTAFVAYLSMVSCALSIVRTNQLCSSAAAQTTKGAKATALRQLSRIASLSHFRLAVVALLGLTFTTAMSGALVAGLDAGLIYNEFPYMGLGLTPPKSELFDPFYSHDPSPEKRDLIWRNFLENPSLVQLDHRILATTTFSAVHLVWAWSRLSSLSKTLPTSAKTRILGLVGFVWLQAILGISTLIYMIPIPIASAHQAGALALLTMTTVVYKRVSVPNEAIAVLARRAGVTVRSLLEQSSAPAAAQPTTLAMKHAGLGAISVGALVSIAPISSGQSQPGPYQHFSLSDEQLVYLKEQQKHGKVGSTPGLP